MKRLLTTLCALLVAASLSGQAWQSNVWTKLDNPPVGGGGGGGGSTAVLLQASSPGTAQTGNLNLTATGIFGNLGININGSATARIEVEAPTGEFALNATSDNATAVVASSTNADGFSGVSIDGYGATGYSENSFSGFFQSSDEANLSATLVTSRVTAGATAPLFEVQDHLGVAKFRVASDGDLTILQGVTLDWPSSNTAGVLTNDGAGALSWAAAGGGMTEQDKLDLAWDKKFFSDAGVLPATERVAASLATFPTPTGSPVGSVTGTAGIGTFADPSMIYWDLGAARSEILAVASGMQFSGGPVTIGLFFSNDQPADSSPTGYFFDRFSGSGTRYRTMKVDGTTFTALVEVTPITIITDFATPVGMALYYNDTTGALKAFLRIYGRWYILIDTTDSTYTTMRYVSIRVDTTAGNGRTFLPFTVWSD